jgi:hypothetical protein
MKETFVLETGVTANKSFKLSSAILTAYLLIASSTCLLVNIFKPLNRWNEVGLILGFIFTLTIAIFTGLLGSMAKGFSEGFAPGLIAGFAISIVLPLFMLDEEFT